MDHIIRRRKEDLPMPAPNAQGNVWPKQSCPAFTERENAVPGMTECWYCRYADFHLDKPKALEVGICNWPETVMK